MAAAQTTPPNTVGSLTAKGIGNAILPKLELSPLPEKALQIIPELKQWWELQNKNLERWRRNANIAINGGAN